MKAWPASCESHTLDSHKPVEGLNQTLSQTESDDPICDLECKAAATLEQIPVNPFRIRLP